MRTGLLKLAVADAILLLFAYFVQQDLAWRSSYTVLRGYASSTSYSLLTRVSHMTGQGLDLQSPPTLDWIQVAVAPLIIINVGYLLGGSKSPDQSPPQQS